MGHGAEHLQRFCRIQDKDSASETLGRIPNRANLDGIIYNTADGTPRFVTDVYEYMQYTGDTSLPRFHIPGGGAGA